MRLVWVIAFTLLAGSAVVPGHAAADFSSNPISRFFSRSEQPLRSYRAYRRMHASTGNSAKYEAWLEAWTELRDGKFSYEIVAERGSDTTRSRVLRAVLSREQELINSGNAAKGDLTQANYEFAEGGRGADGAAFVQIKPRRSDVLLVDGRAVLNERGELMRVEGKLAKNPSFWTSLVNIVRRYARVGGVRVPVATETTAKMKFIGTAQMDVTYEYQTVNGRPIAVSALAPSAPGRSAAQSGSSGGGR
jgi:hypothetical protein